MSSWGRGMTCTLTTSPIRLAAAAPGVGSGLHGGHIPGDKHTDQTAANLVPAKELHVGRLQHRIGGFDQGDESLDLKHAQPLPLLLP